MDSEANNHPANPFEIILPVQDWTLIDATMDNTMVIADQNGDVFTAEQSRIVRMAGWAAAGHHPKAEQGWGGWPPPDENLSIELPAPTWHFIVGQLRRWDEMNSLMNPRRDGEPEAGSLELAQMLEVQLS